MQRCRGTAHLNGSISSNQDRRLEGLSLEDDLASGQAGLLQSREPSTMQGEGVENCRRETLVEDDDFGGESNPRVNHYVPTPPPAHPTSRLPCLTFWPTCSGKMRQIDGRARKTDLKWRGDAKMTIDVTRS